jgi:ATP-dependent RNA helicase RhlE
MTTFSDLNLNKQLSRALDDMGFSEPTPIQQKAFPVIMSGKDMVGIAQTGTGKTIGYLLPVLRQLEYSEQRHPRVLIVVPTRELVVQVVGEIEKLAAYMSCRVAGIYGASNINTQKQQVYDGVDILVSTPGRLIDLTHSRSVIFRDVKRLVIDEVDEMLNLGFRPQLVQLLDMLPQRRQNILFSATLSEEVEAVIQAFFNKPVYVEILTRGTPLEKIIQQAYEVPNFYTKVNLLRWLLVHEKEFNRVLLFVRNKSVADLLMSSLGEFSDTTEVIHSNKSQPARFSAVKRFQEGTVRLLIATDVIARGVDITDITHVINFDLPSDPNVYIHRIGRTGRAEKAGSAVSFILPSDAASLSAIEKLMGIQVSLLPMPTDVEISEELTADEIPVSRDKSLRKIKKIDTPTGGFQEKKAKNQKVQLGGKRRQEKQRRALEKSRQKRKR